jgi:hypothetical protein
MNTGGISTKVTTVTPSISVKTTDLIKLPTYPSAVQSYVSQLQQQVGAGFKVTASIQKDGTYLVSILFITASPCPSGQICADMLTRPVSGSWDRISFVISANGKMDSKSLQAAYLGTNGDIQMDGSLLLRGMKLLQPGASDTSAVVLMTKIAVNKVDSDGTIHFTFDSKNYKVYRDAKGHVKLEEEFPSAVQSYVSQLQEQVLTVS